MSPEDYQQVKEIFQSILELPADRRAAELDVRCPDPGLRREVERLLDSYESGYLEQPLAASLSVDSLDSGHQIGHYKIVKKIGSGGMGDVYLAEDGKLGRHVAIKLLPETFIEDAERLRRFEQEARTASALNHPNILTIFEIGKTENTHYIATEYIEGETLRSKLNRGKISVSEALDVAVQCASALAAAHDSGVIHRDIKPENIMLRPDGVVKVLDFGLAKLVEKQNVAVSHDALTERQLITAPGVIMGTVQYMSPEQTRGHATDARTDIWSLGCVIHEMVAGRPPFSGDNTADLIAEIVKSYPASLSQTAADVPGRLDEIVSKALEKNPGERYQTAKDLLIDLKRLTRKLDLEKEMERSHSPSKREYAPGDTDGIAEPIITNENAGNTGDGRRTSESSAAYIASEIRQHKTATALVSGLVLALSVGIAYTAFYSSVYETPVKKDVPFEAIDISRLTRTGDATDPTLSPDGKFVAYVHTNGRMKSLVVKQIASGSELQIVPPTDVDFLLYPTFSTDGNFVYYTLNQNLVGTLYRVASVGGMPKKVIEDIDYGPAFAPDGGRFAFIRFDPTLSKTNLMIAEREGSNPEVFMETDELGSVTEVAWSPVGDRLLLSATDDGALVDKLFTVSIPGKKIERVGDINWSGSLTPTWDSDGSGILFVAKEESDQTSQVFFMSYPGAETRQITDDPGGFAKISEFAATGLLAVSKPEVLSSLWSLDLNSTEQTQITRENPDLLGNQGIRPLPDGRLLVTKSESGYVDFWTMDEDGKNLIQLTNEHSQDSQPKITPDGKHVVFSSQSGRQNRIWRMDIDGRNRTKLTDSTGSSDNNPAILPDGQTIVFSRRKGSVSSSIMQTTIDGGEAKFVYTDKSDVFDFPSVSKDGRYLSYWVHYWDPQGLAFVSTLKISTIQEGSFVPSDKELKVKGLPIRESEWTHDNKLIYLTRKDPSNLYLWSPAGGQNIKLTNFNAGSVQNFSISRDGKRLFIVRGIVNYDIFLIRDKRSQ